MTVRRKAIVAGSLMSHPIGPEARAKREPKPARRSVNRARFEPNDLGQSLCGSVWDCESWFVSFRDLITVKTDQDSNCDVRANLAENR